jgi:hypothetical protein
MNSKQNQIAILVKNDVSWLELFRLNNWFDKQQYLIVISKKENTTKWRWV